VINGSNYRWDVSGGEVQVQDPLSLWYSGIRFPE